MSDLHQEVKNNLLNEDLEKVKNWQKEVYHKQMMGGFKETKETEEGFRKAQKPWAKKLKEVRRPSFGTLSILKWMCNAVLLNFVLFQRILVNKTYHGFHKNMKQHNCFNTDDNQKCFLNDFWRIMTLKTGVMMLKNTGINYVLKYIQIENGKSVK